MDQLSQPYVNTRKNIALTMGTFFGKVMLSRFVIALLPKGTWLLISWLQSPSSVILEASNINSDM